MRESGVKYSARVIEENDQPGAGWGLRVGIFQRQEHGAEEQIGEYHRNYLSLLHTFCPFQSGGLDYALFSPQYHVTRVMALPACKDIGGENPQAEGFCPTDYYVPSYVEVERSGSATPVPERRRINEPSEQLLVDHSEIRTWVNPVTKEAVESCSRSKPLTARLYYPFGFVAGCVWGDDTTWKIQFLDLSEVQRGIVRRDDRFGYIELPDRMRLREAVDMWDYGWDGEFSRIRIAVLKTFDVHTGEDHSQR
jgi:hypothetical protein